MKTTRLVLIALAAVAVAFLAGVIVGRSGRSEVERVAGDTALRLDLQTGRASVLDARVALYNVNFGDASAHFQRAKTAFERARARLDATDRKADAAALGRATALVDEAQRMAGTLDQGANTKAGEALNVLREVSGLEASPPVGR